MLCTEHDNATIREKHNVLRDEKDKLESAITDGESQTHMQVGSAGLATYVLSLNFALL